MAVLDTGSTDGTLELLGELATGPGAPLILGRSEWRDDFSWARNRALELVPPAAEWWLWLDADHVLVGGERLRELAASETVDAHWFSIDYAIDTAGHVTSRFYVPMLLRVSRRWRWWGIVNEAPVASEAVRRAYVPRERLHVMHLRDTAGAINSDERLGRYLPLLERQVAAERVLAGRASVFSAWTLAYALERLGRTEEAENLYLRVLGEHTAGRGQLYVGLAGLLHRQGREQEAVELLLDALPEFGRDPTGHLLLAEFCAAAGAWPAVRQHARKALDHSGRPLSTPHNPAWLTVRPFTLLATAAYAMGRTAEAARWRRKAQEAAGA